MLDNILPRILNVREKVEAKIKKDTIKELKRYLEKKKPSLWGSDKGRYFVKDCLLLALYHDLEGIGYARIEKEIKQWRPLTSKSIRHNTKEIRQTLSTWADEQIRLGDEHDWNQAYKSLSLNERLEGVNLWMYF